jgi:hypothetical protein
VIPLPGLSTVEFRLGTASLTTSGFIQTMTSRGLLTFRATTGTGESWYDAYWVSRLGQARRGGRVLLPKDSDQVARPVVTTDGRYLVWRLRQNVPMPEVRAPSGPPREVVGKWDIRGSIRTIVGSELLPANTRFEDFVTEVPTVSDARFAWRTTRISMVVAGRIRLERR